MRISRTTAWAISAAALAAALGWEPQPVAGQPPGTTSVEVSPNNAGYEPGSASTADPFVVGRAGRDHDQVTRLARQYVQATKDDEKKDARKKLQDTLGRQFDDQAVRQKKELEDLEKRVADLRTLLQKRHDARDTIIDRRLEQVLREAEGLGWGTPPAAPNFIGTFRPAAK